MEDKLKIKVEAKKPFSIEETKSVLSNQVQLENYKEYKSIIKEISEAFNQAITSTDKEIINSSLNKIKNYENYLAEKYRDTPNEREYIKKVNEAIVYLESL